MWPQIHIFEEILMNKVFFVILPFLDKVIPALLIPGDIVVPLVKQVGMEFSLLGPARLARPPKQQTPKIPNLF